MESACSCITFQNVALSSLQGIWIITDAGVIQHCDDAFQIFEPFVAIGIAMWGCVSGRKSLVKDGVSIIGSIKSNTNIQLLFLKSKYYDAFC